MMNSSMAKILFLFLLSLFTVLACSPKTGKETSAAPPDPKPKADSVALPVFEGTYWRLTELYGSPITDENPKRGGFIMFRANGQMTASAGCNSLTGTYTIKPDMGIAFSSEMASTLMGCPNQAREDQLKKLLGEVNTYKWVGNKLLLSVLDAPPAARLERVIEK